MKPPLFVERARELNDKLTYLANSDPENADTNIVNELASALFAESAAAMEEFERMKYAAQRWRDVANNMWNVNDIERIRAEAIAGATQRTDAVIRAARNVLTQRTHNLSWDINELRRAITDLDNYGAADGE